MLPTETSFGVIFFSIFLIVLDCDKKEIVKCLNIRDEVNQRSAIKYCIVESYSNNILKNDRIDQPMKIDYVQIEQTKSDWFILLKNQ